MPTVTRVFYNVLDPNKIFGAVGRCGGGYNTMWQDWSKDGRIARENIMREYEEGLNKICGHYDKLEKSILAEGFRNPLIITCGVPRRVKLHHLPVEVTSKPMRDWLLLEGVTGGSRLWVAQKYGIPVPCIINDNTGTYSNGKQLKSLDESLKYFKDLPTMSSMHPRRGFVENYDNNKRGYHMEPEWSEEIIVKQRAPLWISTMNKYGYYVDRLQPFVLQILKDAGVVQPESLKNRFVDRR
jgi:hypothetical protein